MKRAASLVLLCSAVACFAAEIVNVGPRGIATANADLWGGANIGLLIDGNTSGTIHANAAPPDGLAYAVDLQKAYAITQFKIYPRQDGCCGDRFSNLKVSIHGAGADGQPGAEVWSTNLFTDGTNPGAAPGTVVTVDLPSAQTGQWVQITSLASPVPDYALQMTELEIYAEVPATEVNRALGTQASSNRPLFGGASPSVLVDGNRGNTAHGNDVIDPGFAYEINLGTEVDISSIVIFPRQDTCCPERLKNFRVSVHKNNNGAPGEMVWSADLHTADTTAGSEFGTRETLTAGMDADGTFKGQWIRILSLDDPVPSYSLQINEVEVYGATLGGAALLLTEDPRDAVVPLGGAAVFDAGVNAINGDPNLITYQWQVDGVNITGGTNATYTNRVVLADAEGKKYRVVVSYPGLASITSGEAKVSINYAYQAQAFSNRPLWPPGGWNISKLVNGDRGDVFHGDAEIETGFAYEARLQAPVRFSHIDIYPRQDGCCPERLSNFRVSIHNDANGSIGQEVWSADYFTDGTNPGSGGGALVRVEKDDSATGTFEGQWIRILALDDPPVAYALQMNELEAFGTLLDTQAKLSIGTQPGNITGAPGRASSVSVGANVFNGDASLITYQWKKNGAVIAGATNATYTTGPLSDSDLGAKYRVVVSYPGLPDVESQDATVQFDYNYARGAKPYSNRLIWGGWSIDMLVDGNLAGVFHGSETIAPGFAYEVDLGGVVNLEKINIYPRQDTCCPERLTNFRVSVHADANGQIGAENWSADFFTDGTNPGSGQGTLVTATPEMDPEGTFRGQWIKITSLEDPVQSYALQMTELEAIGRLEAPLQITVTKTASGHTLNWSEGVLESSETLNAGSWTTVTGAASPYTLPVSSGSRKFFRVRKN